MIDEASDRSSASSGAHSGAGSGYGFDFGPPANQPPPLARAGSGYELRPLSVGEILDRIFSLYRQRFWLYCGLAAGAALFQTVAQLIQILLVSTPGRMTNGRDPKTALFGVAITFLVYLVYFGAYSVTQAATASAVLASYLGHETSLRTALAAVCSHWGRYVLILLWQIWSMIWIFTVLLIPAFALIAMRVPGMAAMASVLFFLASGSMVYGLIAYTRNSLAIAASVMENLKVRPSMRRSKTLAAGGKGRIFLLLLLLFALSLVVGMLQAPIVFLIMRNPLGKHFVAQGLSLLIAFVGSSLVGPVGAIGFCLFYIDARVRKEGFDIEALLDPALGSGRAVDPDPAADELLPSGFAPSGFTAPAPAASPRASGAPASAFPPSESGARPPVAPPPLPATDERDRENR